MSAVRATDLAPGPPIYHQIARVIRSRIFHGLYGAGTAIPSENELAREFGVARLTVRQAIQALRSEGALVSRRGSGTYVTPGLRLVRPVQFVGYLEDLVLQSLTLRTEGRVRRNAVAPAAVCTAYGLKPRTKLTRLERTRYTDGDAVQYSVNYLVPSVARRLDFDRLGSGSLSEMLSKDLGIETTSARQTISAVPANAETARALGLPAGSALLTSEIVGYAGIRCVNYTRVYYRPEHLFFTAILTSVAGDPRLNQRVARRRS